MNAPSNGFGAAEPFDGFRVEHDAGRGVATITLDVPGKFNRVSMLARDQLAAVFDDLDRDETMRFVVLTGAGDNPRRLRQKAGDVAARRELASRTG